MTVPAARSPGRAPEGEARRHGWRATARRTGGRVAIGLAAFAAAMAIGYGRAPAEFRSALLEGGRQLASEFPRRAGLVALGLVGATLFVAVCCRADFWGRVLAGFGLAVFAIETAALLPNTFSGHADFSAYAEMAHSLLQRRGLEVDYISWYFRAYERLPRPEDHWPPFYSFLIAPLYLALGRTALAVRLPGALAGSLLLPQAVRIVAARLSRSPAAGFAAGLHALLYPAFLRFTFSSPVDMASAWIAVLTVALALEGFDSPRAFPWMGLAGGLAAYAKGNNILLLPLFAGLYLVVRMFWPAPTTNAPPASWLRGRRLVLLLSAVLAAAFAYRPIVGLAVLPAAAWLGLAGLAYGRWRGRLVSRAADRDFLAGLAVWIAVVTPWAVRNLRFFGDPFYSTQSHVPAYIGRLSWEKGTYPLYWGHPPRIAERFADRPAYWAMTRRFARQYFWWIFLDTAEPRPGERFSPDRNAPPENVRLGTAARQFVASSFRGEGRGRAYVWAAGLTALVAGVFVLGATAARILLLAVRSCRRAHRRQDPAVPNDSASVPPYSNATDRPPSTAPPFSGLPGWGDPRWLWPPVVGGVLAAFLIFLWEPIHRLESPSIALMLAGAWAFFAVVARGLAALVVRALPRRWRPSRVPAIFAATAALAATWAIAPAQIATWPTLLKSAGVVPRTHHRWIETGQWIAEHLTNSVTMTRNPWQLHFYSQQPAIQIPLAPAEDVVAVMRRFGVTHVIPDHRRPALIACMRRHPEAFPPVFGSGPVTLHEVRYDALPPALRDIPPIPMPR